MSWSSSPPALPAGASWGNTVSIHQAENHWAVTLTTRSARGSDSTYYIEVTTVWSAGSYYDWYPPEPVYLLANNEATSFYASQGATIVRYYTGSAASAVNVTVGVSQYSSYIPSGMPAVTQYVPAPSYWTVSYNGNGADGGSTASQTKVAGVSLTLQSNGFTRDKYVFVEWNTAADGTGTSYAEGASYTANANLVLYAIWKKANIPVYVNVGGVIHQVEKAYANVGGVIKECTVYANVGGTIKEIV